MKLSELQKNLKTNKLDGALIFFKDPSFFYFIQINIDDCFLFIPTKGKPTLFTSNLGAVKTSIKKIIYKNPYVDLKAFFKKNNVKTIGINESSIIVKQKKYISKMAKTKDINSILSKLRETKTKSEISKIKTACKLTEKVIGHIVKNFKFIKEGDIKRFIKIQALKYGCELSFEPIVASGKNAATPHYFGNQKIKKGFLIIDLGLKYNGYCADITRTFYIGKPSNKEIKMYNKFLSVQRQAIKLVKSGVKVKVLETFVRKEMGSDEKYFSHSLGHGLGIKVHESPGISINSNDILEEGMVITIEPGYYKRFGIRIEDDILVTKKGCEILTKFPKELVIIPKL